MRLPRLATRWRITVWVVLSVLIVTFLVGVFAVIGVRNRFTHQIDDNLTTESRGIQAALTILDPDQLAELAGRLPEFADNTNGLTVVWGDGQVMSQPSGSADHPDPPIDTSARALGHLRARAGSPFDLVSADGSETYRTVVRQLDDGGLVILTRPLSDRDDAVRTVVNVLVASGLTAAVLLALTVTVVSGLVTKRLGAMIGAAEEIGGGNLTSRVPQAGHDDVSRLGGALNQMLDRIEDAFADKQASEDALRRFVSDASHELRTPLAAVLGYAELHQAGMTGPDQVDRSMERIQAEGERMRLIVEDLLTLARLDEGRPMQVEPVDVPALVRLAVADAMAIDPDRTIDLRIPTGSVQVAGDAMSLRQAVDNLLTNARTHTPTDAAVTVTVTEDEDTVSVTVRDQGPGLSSEDAAHIFERFYRTDRSRARTSSGPGGSGLGLAIVAAIATHHHGTATVESRPGEGAAFTLRLPRA